jgi:hypothetical protein
MGNDDLLYFQKVYTQIVGGVGTALTGIEPVNIPAHIQGKGSMFPVRHGFRAGTSA